MSPGPHASRPKLTRIRTQKYIKGATLGMNSRWISMKVSVSMLVFGLTSGAFADQEFYGAGSTYYHNTDPLKSPAPGFFSAPKGTYSRLSVGMLSEIALRISATEIHVFLKTQQDMLVGDRMKQFLAGDLVILPSGLRIQYVRGTGAQLNQNQLLLYLADGRLSRIVALVEKK